MFQKNRGVFSTHFHFFNRGVFSTHFEGGRVQLTHLMQRVITPEKLLILCYTCLSPFTPPPFRSRPYYRSKKETGVLDPLFQANVVFQKRVENTPLLLLTNNKTFSSTTSSTLCFQQKFQSLGLETQFIKLFFNFSLRDKIKNIPFRISVLDCGQDW